MRRRPQEGPRSDPRSRAIARALGTVVLVGIAACVAANRVDPAKAERIRHYYGLRPPFQVTEWVGYLDGGSIGFTVRGAFGRQQRFFWDGGMRSGMRPIRRTEEQKISRTIPIDTMPRLLRAGGPDGRPISLGSDEELAVIELLELAAQRRIGPDRLDSLYAALVARPTLDHLKEVRSHLGEQDRRALSAYDLAQGLRRQIRSGRWTTLN